MTAKNKKFTELLNAYLEGEITPAMQIELMQLIKSGEFDDLLKNKVDENFAQFENAGGTHQTPEKLRLADILTIENKTVIETTEKKYNPPWWKLTIAACLAVGLVASGGLLIRKNEKKQQGKPALEMAVLQPAGSNVGRYIHLQDGSTVLLNEGSKLEYPDSFGTTSREVILSGEAYFDIKHDAKKAFIVHTGKVSTTVLGTAFNIKAYPRQQEIVVTVTRGKVKISDGEKILATITPNESLAVNKETKIYKQQTVDAEQAVEWKKQYLVLDNISLSDAAILINTRYHVIISFAKEELKDCRISATFLDNENLEQVMEVVTGVVNAKYSIEPNDKIIISGEGCR